MYEQTESTGYEKPEHEHCTIIYHPTGHDTEECMNRLKVLVRRSLSMNSVLKLIILQATVLKIV